MSNTTDQTARAIYANVEMARLTLAFSHLQVGVFKREKFIRQDIKQDLGRCITLIESADRILKSVLTKEQIEEMETDTIDDDTAIEGCRMLYEFLASPRGIRSQMASYVTSSYNVYALNKDK